MWEDVFFFQNGLQEGEEDGAGFLVELFVVQDVEEPGKTFFLENLFKKDGSKDYPKRLQSCENYWSFGRLLL